MPPLKDILELEEQLEPTARLLVRMMRESFNKLEKQLKGLHKQIEELRQERNELKEQNAEFRRMLFGSSSEKMPPIADEVRRVVEEQELFGKDAAGANDSPDSGTPETAEERETRRRKEGRKKSKKARVQNLLAKKNLPIKHETIVVTEEQLPDGYCLDDFREVSDGEVIRRLEHVKEHLIVVEYRIQCLASKDGEHIITAPSPPSVIEGGSYGPGVYAHTVVSKCIDSLPLYRINKIFGRSGYAIARSSLCNIFHRAAELLEPISKRLLEIACSSHYLSADETRLRVQQNGGCRTGWVWTFVSKSAVAYVFTEGREGHLPENLLEGTSGFLQVDGAAIYDSSCEEKGRTRVGCLGHARRYFFKAQKQNPELVTKILKLFTRLYLVEYKAAEQNILGTKEHLKLRQNESLDLLKEIKKIATEEKPNHTPKSKMGKAITYFTNQWSTFEVIMTDPKLRLDNNLSENALRIIALGRKVFLFSGHDVGAKNLASLQTIMSTCQLHQVNPYEYVKDVLIRIQTHPASKIDELLPQNWQPTR